MNPSDVFIEEYGAAAGRASVFELKARLLADRTPVLEPLAHGRFHPLVTGIVEHFERDLADEERQILPLAQRLRNKIVHSDFHDARAILRELSPAMADGGVQRVDLDTGDVAPVTGSTSTASGGVFGWLLELGSGAGFAAALRVFNHGVDILDRLVLLESQREVERHLRGDL